MGAGQLWRFNRFLCVVLAASALSGCNLLLDNEKRSLRQDSIGAAGGGIPWPALDGSVATLDAAPPPPLDGNNETGSCGGPSQQCAPGDVAMMQESCGSCGKGARVRQRICSDTCQWGQFGEWSECEMPEGLCEPGKTEDKVEACGACDRGTRKVTRSCSNTCSWGNWSMGDCAVDESLCEPGSRMEMPAISCDTMCGKMQQVRVCTATCAWGPVETGACEGQGECRPGDTRMAESGCNPQYCMKGVQQQTQKCTQVCSWGTPTNVGNCTIPPGICRPRDLGSEMGYRCVPNDPGFREVCQLSTANADDRCTYGSPEAFSGC